MVPWGMLKGKSIWRTATNAVLRRNYYDNETPICVDCADELVASTKPIWDITRLLNDAPLGLPHD
jgi:hypothetical protein